MPSPGRTSLDQIVAAGRDILEADGLAAVTMQAVALKVGVRAPSLYKRVADRGHLLQLVAESVVRELSERVDAASAGDTEGALRRLARAFRQFAHTYPAGYLLLFVPAPGVERPGVETLRAATAPVLRVTAELVGEARALEAARTFTAWAHGFVTMELAGAFNLGGDVDGAFEYGMERLSESLVPG